MAFLRFGCAAILVAAQATCALPNRTHAPFEFRQRHMGVEMRIVLYAPDEQEASRAARTAFSRVARLDSIMSDYRPDSELMRLSSSAGRGPMAVSAELFHVLSRAQELARLSGGAFDVTAGPLVRLWRTARRTGVLPTADEREGAAARVGWQHLSLDSAGRTVELRLPGMQLDLGGIAKGYAADEAIASLRQHGLRHALVELGGDIVAGDPPPSAHGWRVEVANAPPEKQTILLARAAVSTSGDTEQFVEIAGERYSHVVDPATGLGLRTRVAATVVAPDGLTADALSTLLSIAGPRAGQAFMDAHFPAVTSYVRRVDLHSSAPAYRNPSGRGAPPAGTSPAQQCRSS